jgi:TonB family protein
MNRRTTRAFACLTFVALLCAFAPAQTTTGGRYEKDGLSFSYPAGWRVEDRSNTQAQHLILTREGGSSLVMVVAYRDLVSTNAQFAAARDQITKPYADSVARELGLKEATALQGALCRPIGDRFAAAGFRVKGQLKGQPSKGEVYVAMLGRRFVSVVFVRPDVEDAQASPDWNAVLETLKVEVPADAPPPAEELRSPISGEVVEGKAIKKPHPEYPDAARSARASGAVVVQIVVDEKGDVISARAVAGHPLLREAGERAARKAKYSPTTVCGKPVKVTGVITYGFSM